MLRENSAKEIEELLKKAPAAVSGSAYTGVSASEPYEDRKSIDEIKNRRRLRFRFRFIDSITAENYR